MILKKTGLSFKCPGRLVSVLLLSLALSGCATGGGARWYAPATWFSHSAATKVDRANAALHLAEDNTVKAAQKAVHQTQMALITAPPRLSTAVAVKSNDNAVTLLDQVNGPMDTGELDAVRVRVAGLISENAAIREQAEADERRSTTKLAEISSKMSAAIRDTRIANDGLRQGFERENALANELRSERALKWILGSLAAVALAAYLYVRFFLGGLPSVTGKLLAQLEAKSPAAADDARSILDNLLHNKPSVQAAIAAAYSKAGP